MHPKVVDSVHPDQEQSDLGLHYFFFIWGFMAHQDYFTHFEPSQSLGGAKTEDPRENLPDHLQAELGLSHM